MVRGHVIVRASARLRTYLPWTSAVLIGLLRTEVGMAAISSGTVSAAESGPGSRSAGPGLKDLAGPDDREVLGIARLLPRASERRAAVCDLLVTRHHGLARSCVRPYLGGPEPVEDLMKVGYVGQLKGDQHLRSGRWRQPGHSCVRAGPSAHSRDPGPGCGEEKMMNRTRTWRGAWSYVSSVIS
jgi:hypothetical protein